MTDIEKKALALIDKTRRNSGLPKARDENARASVAFPALLCAIEQHEAFRQEVSDEIVKLGCWPDTVNLQRFIIAKPDPLVEALAEAGYGSSEEAVYDLRAALAARGLEIREKQP